MADAILAAVAGQYYALHRHQPIPDVKRSDIIGFIARSAALVLIIAGLCVLCS